jgi:cytochrome P450
MSDNEILDQLSTFLFAGSDTTAISIAWVLYYLALNPSIQSELRDELIAAADSSTSDVQHQDPLAQLESLPLLDAVVRETLRIAPPVHGTIRVAMQDDVVPLSEPVTLRTGETVQEIEVKKGSYVHIPIEGLNHSKDIWGDDALEFK